MTVDSGFFVFVFLNDDIPKFKVFKYKWRSPQEEISRVVKAAFSG